jgi:pSer/pThr/pTyr-binding forkhead associated (FHA) protein/soluble lytic murein transglycosylase-like protein
MPDRPATPSQPKAWLISPSGALAGTRYPLADGTTCVGRGPANQIVLDGPDCAMVSQSHLEITRAGDRFRVRDLESTNGTWLDGERITEAEVAAGKTIRLGNQGPEFTFVVEQGTPAELDRTIEMPIAAMAGIASSLPPAGEHDQLLTEAVIRARHLRSEMGHGQTMTIMRHVIDHALNRTRRRWRRAVLALIAALAITAAAGIWRVAVLVHQKHAIDARIREIEAQLEKADANPDQADRLVTQLNEYETQAQSLEHSAFYRLGPRNAGDYLTRELRAVMAEFGAEVYSIPPDFVERVNHYIEIDLGPNRSQISSALNGASRQVQLVRQVLEKEQLPPDLAYIPLVESAVTSTQASSAGAVGPWQLMAPTARAFGLRVDGQVDERKDLLKSTQASSRILRSLILDFGTGSSVMLALAAYNLGPARVKQAVVRTVRDPIKQRNFWYLYRTRALPAETREYVPKVFAAIIIGRDPQHFGL